MLQRCEVIELKWDVMRAGAAVALAGIVGAVLIAGSHPDHLKAVMILSSVVSLTAGLYSVYGGVKLLGPPSAAAKAKLNAAQQRDADLKRQAWLQAAAAFAQHADTSPMEMRLTDTLKFIRDEAEQALIASDAEHARHLRTIWSMAACDLEDDLDHVAH